jgi:hypothetical protein
LKGNVQFINSNTGSIEGMVDNHNDQTIGGIKTFSTAVTASGFFDSTGGGTAIVSSPINTLFGAGEDRVAIFSGSNDLTASNDLTFDGTVLSVGANISSSIHISASAFFGAGTGLTGLPAASITGQVNAANINFGNGLNNVGGALTISASNSSISIDSDGIAVNAAGNTSGLKLGGSGLRVDPNRGTSIDSLAADDEFLVADNNDSNNLKKSTITQLQTYMQNSLSFGGAAGSNSQIQFNSSGDFAGDNTFTFNSTTKVVAATGLSASSNISGSEFYGDGNNLTNINATALNGNVPASNINIGHGLFDDSNSLAVSASFGLSASANGLQVTASATSGLNVSDSIGLFVSPARAITTGSVEDADLVLISDVSDSNQTKAVTMDTIADYMQSELTFTPPGGSNTQLQFNNNGSFGGSSTLTFNSATNILSGVSASFSGVLITNGLRSELTSSSTHTSASLNDEFIIMNNPQPATASLPDINSISGTRLTIKRVGASDVQVSCSVGNKMDGVFNTIDLTSKGEFVSVISDGSTNWLIVGKSGSF